jgi:hypothetical protein
VPDSRWSPQILVSKLSSSKLFNIEQLGVLVFLTVCAIRRGRTTPSGTKAGSQFILLIWDRHRANIESYLLKTAARRELLMCNPPFFLKALLYYSAQILLFGAELTRVYALKYGSRMETNPPRRLQID